MKTIPATGDTFQWEGFKFEIVDMDGNRIDKVLLIVPEEREWVNMGRFMQIPQEVNAKIRMNLVSLSKVRQYFKTCYLIHQLHRISAHP